MYTAILVFLVIILIYCVVAKAYPYRITLTAPPSAEMLSPKFIDFAGIMAAMGIYDYYYMMGPNHYKTKHTTKLQGVVMPQYHLYLMDYQWLIVADGTPKPTDLSKVQSLYDWNPTTPFTAAFIPAQ
jgi:hypothetical protein